MHVLDGAGHVEGLLGDVVQLAFDQHLEAADGVFHLDVAALQAGELLGHEERLRKVLLDFARARHRLLVFFAQLFDAQDGDDVLQVFVALQDGLDRARHIVVLLAQYARVEDARERLQRVHRRVEAQLGHLAREHQSGVQVRESGGGGGVGEVVGGDVDGLHRRDRTFLGGGDALLQLAQLAGQVGLVAHRRGHAPQQRRDFRARLHEAEDVVDEEQHVHALLVAEVLSHRQAGQRDAQAGAGRLGHLPIDQCRARLLGVAGRDYFRLGHLQPEVVAFAGALAHAREHRDAAVLQGHVVDELHDDHGLAHTGAAEQAHLAAAQEGLEQVNHLHAGLEHLLGGGLLFQRRRGAVDGVARLGFDFAQTVHRLAQHVDHAPQGGFAHRHGDGAAGVVGFHAAHDAFGGLHGHAADAVFAQVLLHFDDDVDFPRHLEAFAGDADGVVDGGQILLLELHVHHRADDLHHLAHVLVLAGVHVCLLGLCVTRDS